MSLKQQNDDMQAFLAATPLLPRAEVDAAILNNVEKNIRHEPRKILARFLLIQIASGVATLLVCPQFGIGVESYGGGVLHALHTFELPSLYYLSCGVFFVLFGALLSGAIAGVRDVKRLGSYKYLYFTGYSVLAYGAFMVFGAETYFAASFFWLLGAFVGHMGGFSLGLRLRHAFAS